MTHTIYIYIYIYHLQSLTSIFYLSQSILERRLRIGSQNISMLGQGTCKCIRSILTKSPTCNSLALGTLLAAVFLVQRRRTEVLWRGGASSPRHAFGLSLSAVTAVAGHSSQEKLKRLLWLEENAINFGQMPNDVKRRLSVLSSSVFYYTNLGSNTKINGLAMCLQEPKCLCQDIKTKNNSHVATSSASTD